ncbi:NAD(P)-binding protein [Phanerochaete sordida]|uniref:NAD(P)-binding protein n=1 Tax=Phanerochaete sordida TaxID=48140 RepID=A0A9P3GDZ5_9APHY|nr:NAD(P)-binding protein [Phanerochaete sordida]
MAPLQLLVVGATGKQGSAFVRAATAPVSGADPAFRVVALTRSPDSPAAAALRALGDCVTVVGADLNDEKSVRAVFEGAKTDGGVWGVFVALAFPGLGKDAAGEEAQGKLVVDLACEYGVRHLVYSSAERGHESRDEGATLSYLAKVNIERHIKAKAELGWTILRPVFFMENFKGTIGRITFAVLRAGLKKDTKVQLIASDDIGNVACAVMRSPEQYAGQAITVIGDHLTTRDMEASYMRGAKSAIPSIPNILARSLTAMNPGARSVVQMLESVNADLVERGVKTEERVARCKEIYPGMHDFAAWAASQDASAEQAAGWNGVSLWGLLSGKQ